MFPISELLIHQGEILLIHRVVDFDKDSMTAEAVVSGNNLFSNKNSVPAWLGMEYMAQTVAAHGGLMCKLSGKPVNIGLLLGTRRYTSNVSSFPVGTVLTIDVKRIVQDQALGVFDCRITGENIEVTAHLNVYQPAHAINNNNDGLT